jgi:hypothetical protein
MELRIAIILALASLGAVIGVLAYVMTVRGRCRRRVVSDQNKLTESEAQAPVVPAVPARIEQLPPVQHAPNPACVEVEIKVTSTEAIQTFGEQPEIAVHDKLAPSAEPEIVESSTTAVEEQKLSEESAVDKPLTSTTEEAAQVSEAPTEEDRRVTATITVTDATSDKASQTVELESEGEKEISESAPLTPPTYTGLAPAAQTVKPPSQRDKKRRAPTNSDTTLDVRIQLKFDTRVGVVRSLALVPGRRDGMPKELAVFGTQGDLHLTEFRDDYYEPVPIVGDGKTLREGVEWKGRGDARRWRWLLSGHELYVLASGEVSNIYPFGSVPCLLLHANHAVLCTVSLRGDVEAALVGAGCANFVVLDEATPGVPSGWVLFRNVKPTSVVARRDGKHVLNPLCPLPDVEPDYIGGIRLKGRTWLAGFPPRICFTGALGDNFRVMIDGQPAQPAVDGGFEGPGWDAAKEHLLWFGGKTDTYALQTMDENWERWHAHDFGTGAAICGASIHHVAGGRWRQVRVPVSNSVLVGARPGEVYYCAMRTDTRCDTLTVLAPFDPVWALPIDAAHANKQTARILLVHPAEPITSAGLSHVNRRANHVLKTWIAAINDAGRKQLALSPESDDAKNLWHRYRAVAKQLWRKTR